MWISFGCLCSFIKIWMPCQSAVHVYSCIEFFVLLSTVFFFFLYNKTKQQTHTQHLKVQSKGRERGKDNKNTKVTPLYNHVYPSKNIAKHQWSRAWPHQLVPLYIHMTLFAGGFGFQYVFLHMCGVNQFWIIVFFAAIKPANNILFCIELIQRPESSLRRHKLGLTDQSIRSNDDKTRFTCVHRLMMTGHSQNICRKVPDDVVLHIWQFKFDCSFILNLL